MNKPKEITGDWIKEKCDFAFNKYQSTNKTFDIFTLNPEAVKLYQEITQYQSICPHKYENGVCIYCRKKESGGDSNE